MSAPDALKDLDARGEAAARDLATSAGARPLPPFTVSDDVDAIPVIPASRRTRHRVLAVAAAVLALGAAGAVAAVRRADDPNRRGTPVATAVVRAHGAAWLPPGLEAVGAGEDRGDSVGRATSGLAIYGPSVEDPQVGVALVRDWSIAEVAKDGNGRRFDADGVAALDLSGSGLAPTAILIDDPASPGDGIVALSPGLGPEELVALARATSADGDRATIRASALPAGWTHLADDPGGVFAGSPIAAGRSGPPSTRSIIYAAGDATDPGRMRMVAVETRLGDASVLATVRVAAATTERVEVQGRDALLSTAPSPEAGGHAQLTLTWLEDPGQVVRVTGFGLTRAELLRVAESVTAIDEATWRDLVERAELDLLGDAEGVLLARGSLADGTAWALGTAREHGTGDEGSLDLRVASDGDGDAVSSSFSSSPDRLRASIVTQSGGRRVLGGLVDPEVTAIEVRGTDGERLAGVPTHRVELDPADAEAAGNGVADSSWFVIELTDDAVELVLLDRNGNVLQRHDVRGTDVNPEASATTVPGS